MIKSARELYNLQRSSRTDWFRIVNRGDSAPVAVHIYDHIGLFGVTASDFVKDLTEISGPIELHLNSEGGEVFEGMAIFNALCDRKGVSVIVDSLAASIASVIAMAADPGELAMGPNSEMMIHDAFGIVGGNSDEVRKLADQLDREGNRIARVYAERTGGSEAEWRKVMREEKWYDQDEAVAAGLADKVLARTKNSLDARPQNAATPPYVGARQTRHEPMTGDHEHDHGAGGHSDADDGIHAHVHHHEGDAIHDSHKHAEPHDTTDHGDGSVLHGRYMDELLLHVSNRVFTEVKNWDGSAAMASCKTAADYRKVCAGERSAGDPDSSAHWALPHHSSPGAGPDKGGVQAALGRWNQTEGLKNKDGARAHLLAHASTLGLPSGDSEDHMNTTIYDDTDAANLIKALRG
jgi:ATP-dependent protease ClpP protease subunit